MTNSTKNSIDYVIINMLAQTYVITGYKGIYSIAPRGEAFGEEFVTPSFQKVIKLDALGTGYFMDHLFQKGSW